MLSFKTKAKVTKVGVGVVDFNSYKYKVAEADIANIRNFYVFLPIKAKVEVGDCLDIQACSLTSYEPEGSKSTLALRVDKFTVIPEEEFTPENAFKVYVNGCVIRTDKAVVKHVGPTAQPMLKCTLCVLNENHKRFDVLLVGYCNGCTLLESIESGRYINCTAILYQQVNSRGSRRYQLNIKEYEYVTKKGEIKND